MKQNPMQDWLKQDAQNLFGADSAMLKTLKDFGAEIDPVVLARLQSEYFVELGNLWKDFCLLSFQKSRIVDFPAEDWQNNRCMPITSPSIY